MQTLTDLLRGQHRRIEELSSALTSAVLEGDALRSTAQLELFRAAVLEHLELEDVELYPRLLDAVGPRTEHGRIVKTYAANMKRISDSLKEFLDRQQQVVSTASFEREWREVTQMLAARIQSEERILYPMYDNSVRGRTSEE